MKAPPSQQHELKHLSHNYTKPDPECRNMFFFFLIMIFIDIFKNDL